MDFSNAKSVSNAINVRSNFVNYPIRFFNMMHFQRPTTMVELFKWCALLAESHGLLDRITDTLSRYPITNVVATNDVGDHQSFWADLYNNKLNIQDELVANGKDYFTFGNCIVSIVPPFRRYLVCPKCGSWMSHMINGDVPEDSRFSWSFKQFKFYGNCLNKDEEGKRCGYKGKMEVKDVFLKGQEFAENIKIHRFPVSNIKIKELGICGKKRIYYRLEKKYSSGISKGDRFIVANVPHTFILAVEKNANTAIIELLPELTFHYKYESITESESEGLAKPFFMSAWKDIFMSFVLRKAQEMIAADHMIPNRFIFPSTTPDGRGPLSQIDGSAWASIISTQLKRQQNDPNEVGVVPFPIGYQALGGQGKAMSLMNEIEMQDRRILTQLGIPPELIYGGMTWSGSNISLRMLENFFRYLINKQNKFLEFLTNYISNMTNVQAPTSVKLSPFKMADDIQQINLRTTLGAQGRISETSALAHVDGINLQAEAEQAEKDQAFIQRITIARQKAANAANMEISKENTMSQVNVNISSQMRQQEATTSAQSGITDGYIANTPQGLINKLNSMSYQERMGELRNLQRQSPEMYNQIVSSMMGQKQEPQPLPEIKAPRRGADKAQV